MKVLVVYDHPRRDSLSGAVLDAFVEGLTEAGHSADIADLYAEGFDPRMPLADEPDWDDDDKVYSDAVLAEQARIEPFGIEMQSLSSFRSGGGRFRR
jgi:NAD(P)H dehydrogenase (quinone)